MRKKQSEVFSSGKKRIHFAWIVLIGVCLFMGLSRSGISSAGGLFMGPVMAELGCGAGEFMLYFSISSIVTFLFLPAAGKLMDRVDIRLLLVAGLIFHAGGFALFGRMRSILGFYLLSVPMAMGAVFTTQLAGPVLIGSWFQKHSGLAMGIMMASAGLCGAVLQPVAGALIEARGYRSAYLVLGVAVMAVGIPTVLLTVRREPGQKGLQPLGAGELPGADAADGTDIAVGMDAVNAAATPGVIHVPDVTDTPDLTAALNVTVVPDVRAALPGVTAKAARRTASFWSLALFMFLITAVASFSQHMPKYAGQLGYDSAFAGGAMGFFMLGMLAGSLVFGLLSDKAGVKRAALFALACGMTGILTAIFLGGRPVFFRLGVAIYGFASASVGTLGPLLTASVFGQREYSGIYPSMVMGTALAGIVAMPGYGFIFDVAGDYTPALWLICGMLLLCMICVTAAFAGKKKMVRDGIWEP